MADPTAGDRTTPRHPIRVVTRRTGLKPDLIRAWERRYGAVSPGRTDGKHRLYSDADLERLRLLHQATQGGRSIRHVAGLSEAALRTLILDDQRLEERPLEAIRAAQSPSLPEATEHHLQACLEAVRQLDANRLQVLLEQAEVEVTRRHLIQHILSPMMVRIGELWHEGKLRPLHEHLATAVVRSFLGNLHKAYPLQPTAPTLVVTTPQGQSHEIGALLAAATAAGEGWKVVYLGPDLPAEEIVAGCRQAGARALALSIVYPADDPYLGEELRRIGRHLDPSAALLVGGHSAAGYASHLEAIDARQIADLEHLRDALAALRKNP